MAQEKEANEQKNQSGRAPGPNILAELRAHLDEFPDALARIAKYIVENPEKVVYQSLADLSLYAKSGQASVVRLCQELGLGGFSDLKLTLAAELARRPAPITDPSGGPAAVKNLVSGLSASLEDTGNLIDLAVLDKVATRLIASRRIDIYGAGMSGIAAELVTYRLLRLGLNAQNFRDPNLAHEVATGLKEGSTAIAISESGVSPDTVDFLRCARSGGAYTIAICCRPRSAVAEFADDMLRMAYGDLPSAVGAATLMARVVVIIEVLAHVIASQNGDSDAST